MLLETVFLFLAAAVMALVARAAVHEFYATTVKKCEPDAVNYFVRTSAEWSAKRAALAGLAFALEPLFASHYYHHSPPPKALLALRYVAGVALTGAAAMAYRYGWTPALEINATFSAAFPAVPRPAPVLTRDVEQR